jgi:hypothetical protein
MLNIEKALLDHELIVLRVIGEWWELELSGAEKLACVKSLAEALGRLNMKEEINYLTLEEATAFNALIKSGGRIPVAAFERTHGTIRHMGPGRMEREEPWLDPVSPAEALWYRGFLFRAFEEVEGSELVEYYYIPDELFQQFPKRQSTVEASADPQSPPLLPTSEPNNFLVDSVAAVDDLTAILAAAQIRPVREDDLDWLQPFLLDGNLDRALMLFTLAEELQLLRPTDEGARPTRQIVSWLQQSREEQLRGLADTWSQSVWNELCSMPGLICEGSGWQNDPTLARTTLLDSLPRDSSWFRLSDLIMFIKEGTPDFQRPDGKYDTWYIRDLQTGEYITDFANWHLVEGRLLRFLIRGSMYWLGLVEVSESDGQEDVLFRLTPRALDWLKDELVKTEEVTVPIVVHDDATITVPFNANRYHRFQVARVAEANPVHPGSQFRYRLTPSTLSRAKDQGITPERLLDFLGKVSGRPVPPSTKRAIERWAERGTEGFLEEVVLLRVGEPEILDKLKANPKTRNFIAESMGDLAVVVRRGDWPKLQQVAAQLGLLLDYHDAKSQ